VDLDGNGFIELGELKQALDLCGFKIPQYQVRQMIDEVDQLSGSRKGHLSFEQFEVVIYSFISFQRKKSIDKRKELIIITFVTVLVVRWS